MNTNMVVIEGNLTRDPEIRDAGKAQVSNFGIAVNKRVRVDGEWKNGDPQFFDIQAWGFDAERSMQLSKGDAVIVVGELNFSQYEKDGQKRQMIRITARALGRQLPRVDAPAPKSTSDDDEIPF
jgi:single-strand DNA-binding protein